MMADTAIAGNEKFNKRQFVIADGAYPREYDITFPERVDGRLEKRDLSTSEKVFEDKSFDSHLNVILIILF